MFDATAVLAVSSIEFVSSMIKHDIKHYPDKKILKDFS